MSDDPAWYFDGKRLPLKALRFLNLLEDGAVKLSLTGIMLWWTTLNNIHAQAIAHDVTTQAFALGGNIVGLAGHVMKRWPEWRKP